MAAPSFGAMYSKAQATGTPATGSGSGAGSNSLSAGNLGTTFLNLLVQELQNQDPTQPMDPTAMVGQMISLNQLDQLISINSALTPAPAASTTTGQGSVAHAIPGAGASVSPSPQAAPNTTPGGLPPNSAALDNNQAALAALAAQSAAAQAASNPAIPLNLGSFGNLNAIR